MNPLRRIILLVILLLLGSRMISSGVSSYYQANLRVSADTEAAEKLLSWDADNYQALNVLFDARYADSKAGDVDISMLSRAINRQPLDTRALVSIADQLRETQPTTTDSMVTVASELMPASVALHLKAAAYWVYRGQLSMALKQWSLALELSPGLSPQLYPTFLKMAKHVEYRHYFKEMAGQSPSWWGHFIAYLVRETDQADVVLDIAGYRQAAIDRLPDTERQHYVDYFIRNRMWDNAYVLWVQGLDTVSSRHIAGVYDGSFELSRSSSPFDWQIDSTRHTQTRVKRTFGAKGEKALQIKFNDEEMRYRHLSQVFHLPPGNYRMSAIKRTEQLTGRGRLKWRLYCMTPDQVLSAESRPILPSIDWEPVKFTFKIPEREACRSQLLRLETADANEILNHRLKGIVWIDDIKITASQKVDKYF